MAGMSAVEVKIYGGLGNQMFQYAAGRALAIRTGLPLKLDLGFYAKRRHRRFELERFPIKAEVLPQSGPVRRWLDKILPSAGPALFKEASFRFDGRFASLDHASKLDGYFQSPRYFDGATTVIRKELCPPVPASAGTIVLGERMRRTNAISLHVRRGDYVSDKNAASVFAECTSAYYRGALEKMPESPEVIVFSDDHRWVKGNMDFGRPVRFAGDETDTDGLGDLWLMTQASHHIIANSTFSWWGAWLKVGDGVTIAPRPWFRAADMDETDLIPDGWLRVDAEGNEA